MYDLINAHTAVILQYSKLQSDVRDYDWLVQNLPQVAGAQFKAKYKVYWRMNVARLSPAYYNVYFQSLQSARLNPPTLTAVAANLYTTPTNAKGRSLQFSFATKLLHMVNPKTPIYDSEVAAFYFFEEPKSKRARPPFATQLWQQKLADYELPHISCSRI
jgi:hypothetical protein